MIKMLELHKKKCATGDEDGVFARRITNQLRFDCYMRCSAKRTETAVHAMAGSFKAHPKSTT